MKIDGTNISMTRGDSEDLYVQCVDDGGAPVPLVAGDTVYFTVKKHVNTEDKLIQKAITEFDQGVAHIAILPADTRPLRFKKKYVYDVQVTFADGRVRTIILPSAFVVTEEVTYE